MTSDNKQIRVSVAADGTVSAETLGFTGPSCLDQVAVLEDLLDAIATTSEFTDDYRRDSTQIEGVAPNELGQG